MKYGGPEGEKRCIKHWNKVWENIACNSMLPPSLVLVVMCLHGAYILHGEVLSSLVWSDLFTLQTRLQLSNTYQNIYSLSACFSAPSTNLHHILNPSTTVLFSLCWVFFVFWPTIHCLTLQFPPSVVTPFSFIFPLFFVFLCVFDHRFYNSSQSDAPGAVLAPITTWEHRAEVTGRVGGFICIESINMYFLEFMFAHIIIISVLFCFVFKIVKTQIFVSLSS